jgi:hypothetical protein
MLINIVKKDIEEQSNPTEPVNELDSQVPLMVNLPENLRLK